VDEETGSEDGAGGEEREEETVSDETETKTDTDPESIVTSVLR
jgi:hypothetical protein